MNLPNRNGGSSPPAFYSILRDVIVVGLGGYLVATYRTTVAAMKQHHLALNPLQTAIASLNMPETVAVVIIFLALFGWILVAVTRRRSHNSHGPLDTPKKPLPRIHLEISRVTIDKTSEPSDPRVVAVLLVSNDGDPVILKDWQMFYRYAGQDERAGKQSVYDGWVIDEIISPIANEGGNWSPPEHIDQVTSRVIGTRPTEAFFYAKLHNARDFSEKDASTIFLRCSYGNGHYWDSLTVPAGNIRRGIITLRELAT